jgi:hypothetical protein
MFITGEPIDLDVADRDAAATTIAAKAGTLSRRAGS